jgi:hypothetical protein
MRKYIILFAATACLFTALQAQNLPKITEIRGKESTRPTYLNLKTDTLFYSRNITKIYNLQIHFEFELTNGNIPMVEGDSIKIQGRVSSTYFPYMAPDTNMYRYALTRNLDAGESIRIEIPGPESMYGYYSGSLLKPIHEDSAYTLQVCGRVLYADGYMKITNPTVTEECVTAHLFKSPEKPPTAVSESIMEKVRFYPNPVNNNLNITNLNNISVEIYNIVGQRIVQYENISGDLVIEMKEYSDGIYFVKLQSGKFVRTEKIKLVK